MDRTELFLAIIAYTLIVMVFVDSGEYGEFALIPLFVLLFALPIYVVIHLVNNPSLE
ncbi:hypothetical protein [Natronorubrum halophilum]|uniref:hypothetical protein n=1 Tax=Natronorubrum halophilum TaxID=1702106 RepID=UPI0013CE86EC|nr:hypothetical protein [Natronorubrum halophilum]